MSWCIAFLSRCQFCAYVPASPAAPASADMAPYYEYACATYNWPVDRALLEKMQATNAAKIKEFDTKIAGGCCPFYCISPFHNCIVITSALIPCSLFCALSNFDGVVQTQ